jgi:hypothetical protein
MRVLLAVGLLAAVVAGCTPYIPVREAFGTSAAVPAGEIPPEFASFNVYNAGVNGLVASQICALPYEPRDVKFLDAAPGQIVQAQVRCQTHIPVIGP